MRHSIIGCFRISGASAGEGSEGTDQTGREEAQLEPEERKDRHTHPNSTAQADEEMPSPSEAVVPRDRISGARDSGSNEKARSGDE